MRIQVRLFAALAEAAGRRSLSLDLPRDSRVWQVRDALALEHPRLEPLCARVAFAVNAEYVDADQVLHEGDEVAVIPPVSGG
jgi:molybdopterin converting factor subunit 1